MKRASAILFLCFVLLAGAMALKGQLLSLPDVRPAAAPGTFDTNRAMARLGRILGDERPHPVDSDANDGVRARLMAELRAAGLSPTVTDDLACNGSGSIITCARIRNVLATIGPREGRHVLMVSHYDSAVVGPGAADDGIGTAVMIETAAILAQRPLERPITFLFNEGEESGLIGARAFMERNPLASRVDAIVNLEARGVTGPAIMFETSVPTAAPLAYYGRAVDRPAANSLSTDFYRMIPNATNVNVFAERKDWTILNFSVIGNETRYHSPGDNLSALDPKSVQHMGDQALAVVTDLANGGRVEASGTVIFADILNRLLIVLPMETGATLIGLLLLAFLLIARRRRSLGRPLLAVVTGTAAAAGLAWLARLLVGSVRPGEYWRGYPDMMTLALDLSALLAGTAALVWIARGISPKRLRPAFWLWWLVIGAVTGFKAPGAIIFFLFPPLVMAAGILLQRWARRAETIAAVAAAALFFLMLGPLLYLLVVLLDHDISWAFAPLTVPLLMPFLIELKPLMEQAGRKRALSGAALLFVAGWIAVALTPAYSIDRKQQFGIEYGWDADARQGRWAIVNDDVPLPDAIQRFAAFRRNVEVPWSGRPRWAAAAPALPVPAPALELLRETATPAGRRVTLRLRGNGSDMISIRIPHAASPAAVTVNGRTRAFGKANAKEGYTLRCHGRMCADFAFDLDLKGKAPAEITLLGYRPGLPAAGAPLLRARPATAAPQYTRDATIVVSKRRI